MGHASDRAGGWDVTYYCPGWNINQWCQRFGAGNKEGGAGIHLCDNISLNIFFYVKSI